MEKWNYSLPEGTDKSLQIDWNQTLVTKLNSLSKEIVGTTIVYIPIKLKPIIETLSFYCDGKIGDKYIVNFIDEDSSIIYISDIGLQIENY